MTVLENLEMGAYIHKSPHQGRAGRHLCPLPPAFGAQEPDRRNPLRRRAADAGHGQSPHQPSQAADARRAIHGSCSHSGGADLRHHRRAPQGGAPPSSWWSRTRRWPWPSLTVPTFSNPAPSRSPAPARSWRPPTPSRKPIWAVKYEKAPRPGCFFVLVGGRSPIDPETVKKTSLKMSETEQRGGVCAGGQKAPPRVQSNRILKLFLKVSKSAQRGEKTFSTR